VSVGTWGCAGGEGGGLSLSLTPLPAWSGGMRSHEVQPEPQQLDSLGRSFATLRYGSWAP
jgi:hypothetical protein